MWRHLGEADTCSSRWSGGTTTQLAIAPEGADYGKRDFLWRGGAGPGGGGGGGFGHRALPPMPSATGDGGRGFLAALEMTGL